MSAEQPVDAEGLPLRMRISRRAGASTVELLVNGNLRTNASGASTIRYSGSPTDVVKKASGASTVAPK
ncbi:MAG: hypothetical protein IPG58_14935 [Acidobacteria bacterium]|nr:hypothetical protein [Acidobacteriota bacterium]